MAVQQTAPRLPETAPPGSITLVRAAEQLGLEPGSLYRHARRGTLAVVAYFEEL